MGHIFCTVTNPLPVSSWEKAWTPVIWETLRPRENLEKASALNETLGKGLVCVQYLEKALYLRTVRMLGSSEDKGKA